MSLSEREAEIIRLNLCLGDERKRNSELLRLQEMPMPAASPKRVRSSSRGVPPAAPTLHQPQLSMGSESQYSLAPRQMLMDSPYFQKACQQSLALQTEPGEAHSQECQTADDPFKALEAKYKALLKNESIANTELTEQVQ